MMRRSMLLVLVCVAVLSGCSGSHHISVTGTRSSSHATPEGGKAPVAQHGHSCAVRVIGARILDQSGHVLYRDPGGFGTHPHLHQVRCSGPTIWVVFNNGAAMSQEAYVGVRSGDAGRTWRLVFAEPYFGVKAPHELDSYMGPWTLVGRLADFTGSCPACSPKKMVGLWVTRNLGRTFRSYPIRALGGFEPTRIRVHRSRVTIWGSRVLRGEPPEERVTVRVG